MSDESDRYIVHNILYKLAVDNSGIFGYDDEAAMKVNVEKNCEHAQWGICRYICILINAHHPHTYHAGTCPRWRDTNSKASSHTSTATFLTFIFR